jgi:predicted P-loop ATPase
MINRNFKGTTFLKDTVLPTRAFNRVLLVKEFLDRHYDIRMNVFDNSRITIASRTKDYKQEISMEDISLHLIEEEITGCDTILKKILTSPNQTRPYNPIKEYFEGLKGKYSGESHIGMLCGFLKAHDYGDKTECYYQDRLLYTLRKWIVATVACAMGTRGNDAMFVVVNSQEGIGKSTLLEFLVPDQLKSYYSVSTREMKFPELFTSKLVLNFDEMIGLTRVTAEMFKSYLSATNLDVARRFATATRQRYASTCGTSNMDPENGGFLLPNMGFRRFAINQVDSINFEYMNRVSPDQIWAEAVMLMGQSFDYRWNQEDFLEFGEYNKRFVLQTNSFKLISEFYRLPLPGETEGRVFKMPMEILRDLRKARKVNSSMHTVNEVNIGIALRQLGYDRYDKKINGHARHGYDVIPLF